MAFRQASSTKQVSQLIEHGTETSMPRCGWLAPGCPRLKACSGAWCTSARKNPWSSTWYALAHVVVQPDGTHMSTRMNDTTPIALHEPCSHPHCVKPAPIHAAQQTGTESHKHTSHALCSQVFSQFPGALKMVGRALAVQQPPISFVGLLEVRRGPVSMSCWSLSTQWSRCWNSFMQLSIHMPAAGSVLFHHHVACAEVR